MKKLSEITRTEIFFTGSLDHAISADKKPIERILSNSLSLEQETKVIDHSFEVCFFRDFGKAGIIDRQRSEFSEKQTFDNVFILSDSSIVLVEAKAHQKFSPAQIDNMVRAKAFIQDSSKLPWNKVYLMGIKSSKYKPKASTSCPFDAVIDWSMLAVKYEGFSRIFERADCIYND